MGQSIQEWTKCNLTKPLTNLKLSLQIFKGSLPQILLGPFLNSLSHVRNEEHIGLGQISTTSLSLMNKYILSHKEN